MHVVSNRTTGLEPVSAGVSGCGAPVAGQRVAVGENVAWRHSHVQFGTVHLVPRRRSARRPSACGRGAGSREAAARAWINRIFAEAKRSRAAGAVLGMQADMWDSAAPASELSAFAPFKARIADRAAHFGRPVWLLEGDSHILKIDRPAGMPPNLTRVVVQGSTNTLHEWLRLNVQPRTARVLSCESVILGSGATTPGPNP